MRLTLVVSTIILFASCASPRAAPTPPAAGEGAAVAQRLLPLDDEARRWVDSTLASLDVKGKAGQMVMAWFGGRFMPVDSDELAAARRTIGAGVGGVIVSIGHPLAIADKLNRFQRLADVPLLVATDMENGPAMRLRGGQLLPSGTELGGGTVFPPVMAIGATGEPDLAYELGRVTAIEGRAAGIHLDFAPVVDVNNNPANPVINTRSYGGDPEAVGRFGAAQVRGLQDHGMLATAKHFPGHGDVAGDSHLVPLILRIDAARADSIELVPFRAAIDAGVAAVMSAHITFPALTGDSLRPATLSPRMLDSLLVREMGFDGLVVTDALTMGAIVSRYGPEEAALLALEAGADILLQPTDPVRTVAAVAEAVEEGRISEDRLDRSARKILEAKVRVGLHRQRTVDLDALAERVGGRDHEALARRVAERSITLVRDREALVPLGPGHPRVLTVVYTDESDPFAGRYFLAAMEEELPGMERVRLGDGTPAVVLDSVRDRAAAADLVLLVSQVRTRSSKGTIGIEEPVAELFRSIAIATPTIALSFGSPYILQQIPGVGTYMLAWGPDRPSQVAAARALLGRAPITGRLPIDIPPLHRRGEGLVRDSVPVGPRRAAFRPGSRVRDGSRDRRTTGPGSGGDLDQAFLDSVDVAVRNAIADGITPGAVVAIGRREGTVRVRGFGALDWAPGAPPAEPTSVYDLASLTKIVGTTTAVMLLVDRGEMVLDAPLSRYLPRWPKGGWRDSVTIRRLLRHEAGLAPFVRFWHPDAGALRGADAVLDAIVALDPAYSPGERMVYSDLGFILLGATVEAVTGTPLNAFLDREVWTPLGMEDTRFNPRPDLMGAPGDTVPLRRIAPTEVDTVYRHTHVHGVVHDENAHAIGGVAGHAGLFSTAEDLSRFAGMMLAGGQGPQVRVLRPGTVSEFTTGIPGSDRALGWQKPTTRNIGAPFTESAFGHTGFTGTSLWMDPELDLYVVILTNRVNPTRAQGGISELRRAVHALAVRAARGAVERESERE